MWEAEYDVIWMCITKIMITLKEGDCTLQTIWTLPRFYMKENACGKHNILNERECMSQTLHRF